MSTLKIVVIVLIVAGLIGLVYGGITYTKRTHVTELGQLKLSVTNKETINLPLWAGAGAVLIGGTLLLLVRRKS